MVPDELRARRDAIVREHADAENRHDFDVALDSFHHPRYELMPTGEVIDGRGGGGGLLPRDAGRVPGPAEPGSLACITPTTSC